MEKYKQNVKDPLYQKFEKIIEIKEKFFRINLKNLFFFFL